MSAQVTLVTTSGQVLRAVSYRMAGSSPLPPSPSVPASPLPFNGGFYHLETARGWVDIPANEVHNISLRFGAST